MPDGKKLVYMLSRPVVAVTYPVIPNVSNGRQLFFIRRGKNAAQLTSFYINSILKQ